MAAADLPVRNDVGRSHPRRSRRTAGIAAAGIAAVAIIVGATVALLSGPGPQSSKTHRGATVPSTSAPHSSVATPPALPAFTGQPGAAIQQQLVQNYLGLLPDNATVAWQLLDPSYQATFSNENAWAAQWQSYQSISVSNLRRELESRFQADLLEVGKDGTKTKQRMGFSVHWDGSTVFIASEKSIGSPQPQN